MRAMEALGPRLGDELVALRRQIDRLELRFPVLASEFERSREWDADGSNTALDWIRFNCHMTGGAAGNALSVGENLARLTHTVDASERGDVGYAHVVVMARTAGAVGGRFDESKLLPRTVRVVVRRSSDCGGMGVDLARKPGDFRAQGPRKRSPYGRIQWDGPTVLIAGRS